MFLIRMTGIWLMLVAVIALVVDGTKSLSSSQLIWTSLGEQWANASKNSLESTQMFIVNNLGTFIWDPLVYSILLWPSWAIIGLLGLFFYWLARKKHQTQVFIN